MRRNLSLDCGRGRWNSKIMPEYICPNCKQTNNDDEALLCLFCGESLGRTSNSALGKIKSRNLKWIFGIIVLIVIVSFLILM